MRAVYRELAESADGITFTYVRGVSPADLVARWGGDIAAFTPMSFEDMAWNCYSRNKPLPFLAVTAIGDWTLAVDDHMIGVINEIIQPLSLNGRVVSHYLQEITGIYEFRWVEDGRIEFGFYGEDGFISGDPDTNMPAGWDVVPESFAAILARSDTMFPDRPEINNGPVFTWAEDLTGITLTPPMLDGLEFVAGRIPRPEVAQ
ncbi:DUF6461 domain-containing protein [Herbidospora daliensis]|uniref:DUF6461 domain-containing protein n=1 Tax=Herbidospora daliensis TaxID=295585 RepID=UPI000AE8BC47|nr:DUF6461 domain-containing protein [Herbidospora daliensis]